MMKLLNNY